MNYELLKQLLSVQPGKGSFVPNGNWRELFRFYNSNKPADTPHLSMSCSPCFDKVYTFCREWLLKEIIIKENPPANPNVAAQPAEVFNA